ncbi:FAD-binding oxidoreductase [Mycobacterium stomatepiae]|uniref:Dehydrogenase n=1 Tax=Mycobacterium stomatepiae TaxID=470076 RepID=A0A7I7QD13_9MYCO|nr:FAD-dependent oxidoreductase [Mycobacterium stomatepiae]MCV7164969.1 FAD-dependent oxidoreductase [Mycobacterium stomatepiae]BBY24159.1 dehydrogenase [Mycobacterium stomatepiae]
MNYVDELVGAAGEDSVRIDLAARQRASKDFAWLSPILARDLPDVIADVVVRPRHREQIPAILAVAYRHRIPLVPRGRGTGNYGQAVPLHGGIVLDLSDCRTVLSIDDEFVIAEAGCTFEQLESELTAVGREVAVMPSTATSTIGGFLSGGNQGIGSIEHGSIWDGWVHELTIVGCQPQPQPLQVSGEGLRRHLHAFGTTGVITTVTLRHSAKRDRTALFGSFTTMKQAAHAGQQLMDLPQLPRAISVDDEAAYRHYPQHSGMVGAVLLRTILDVDQVDAARAIVVAAGGQVTATDVKAIGAISRSVYNHTTVMVARGRPGTTAVQIRGNAIIDHEEDVRRVLPEVCIHLDGNAPAGYGKGFSGLLFSQWIDDATLARGIGALRELGVRVVSPHTWMVGSHGGLEHYQAASAQHDPLGLLNPGKLPASGRPISAFVTTRAIR